MQSGNTQTCHSLYDLLNRYEVRIPIIQRDYAQGRNNSKATEVRKRLIKDFITCLENPNFSMDFNFIYGNTEGNIFYPVDGQQRLTSLYLLHWLLACRCEKIQDFCSLYAFTYATRNSSNEFFSLLKKPTPDLISLAQETEFIQKIKNYPWFPTEWNNDQTIVSALTFLDDLCKALDSRNNYNILYNRLIAKDSAIFFTMLEENSGSNAECAAAIKYIRMNARGKELTTFENVKAMLDAIYEKLKISINISELYDQKHIDIFYDMVNQKDLSIPEKTRDLNQKSLVFFKNVYNVLKLIENQDYELITDLDFMNNLYEVSQLNNCSDSATFIFFESYYEMLNCILYGCKNITIRAKLEKVFNESFNPNEDRNEIAYILYLYSLNTSQMDNNLIYSLHNQLDKLEYVLSNLDFVHWKDSDYINTNDLIKNIANDTDAISFFANHHFKIKDDAVLNDIQVRIKEQHIKAKIIIEYNKDYRYFDKLEVQAECRKIQYLLWISNMWTDNDEDITNDNVNKLFGYMKTAEKYFNRNKLEWYKRFAVAGCTEKNTLLDAISINKINWYTRCQWLDKYYYWSDIDQPNTNKLHILKDAYENETGLYHTYIQKLWDAIYENCWLRYAVFKDYSILLECPITWNDSNQRVNIQLKNNGERDFMTEVLILDIVNKQKYYEQTNAYINPSHYRVNICMYGKLKLYNTNSNTWTFKANKEYQHSIQEQLYFKDWRNYNLTLRGTATIDLPNQHNTPLVSSYNLITNELCIYEPNLSNNKFTEFNLYIYNLEETIKNVNTTMNEYISEFNGITDDKLLEIYYGKSTWKHDGGATHSWHKTKRHIAKEPNVTKYILK